MVAISGCFFFSPLDPPLCLISDEVEIFLCVKKLYGVVTLTMNLDFPTQTFCNLFLYLFETLTSVVYLMKEVEAKILIKDCVEPFM